MQKRVSLAFTIIELLITISVIAVLAGIVTFAATSIQKNSRDTARDAQVRILSTSLEKYYRDNGEYPSVAAMTTNDVDTLKKKLGITDPSIFALPTSTTANSIASANPSPTTLVYSANTTDTTKNTQCQTDANGYCDGYTLAYTKEANGSVATIQSLHATFAAVHDSSVCDAGDTQNGTTCTHTYAGTYNAGAYTCPSGGSLSGTTCTNTYAANYSSGGGYYYCPSGGSLSGGTCTLTGNSYSATCPSGYQMFNDATCHSYYQGQGSSSFGSCPSGYTMDTYEQAYNCVNNSPASGVTPTCAAGGTRNGTVCSTSGTSYAASYQSATYTKSCPNGGSLLNDSVCYYSATATNTYSCPHTNDSLYSGSTCYHNRTSYTTSLSCSNAGYYWNGSNCFNYHAADVSGTTYSCASGWSLSGGVCTQSPTSTQTSPGYYYCPNGGSLSGSTCIQSTTYSATYYSYPGYYYCSGSGTLNGTTCTSVYTGTQGAGYYTCPSGGVASGANCSYTYELQG